MLRVSNVYDFMKLGIMKCGHRHIKVIDTSINFRIIVIITEIMATCILEHFESTKNNQIDLDISE